jgi:hypothetical protein
VHSWRVDWKVPLYACIYVCMHVCMYLYMYVYIYIYMYTYIYTYKYTCTLVFLPHLTHRRMGKPGYLEFDVRKSVHHHTIQINQPTRCNCFLRVYYSTFICDSTCFGSLSAHHQKHTTVPGASGSTFGKKRLERCWSWSGWWPEAPSAVVCSWWWAGRRPTHVEPHMNVE